MPKEQGVFRRLLVKLVPQFSEDWEGKPGEQFRSGITRISDYMKDVQVAEKAQEAHDLLWNRARGEGHEKLAKAESDYAKAENDRIEIELRRRTFDAQVRHVEADADKAESDAAIAKLKIVEQQLILIEKAQQIGVSINWEAPNKISVAPLLSVHNIKPQALTEAIEEVSGIRGAIHSIVVDRDCSGFLIDWSVTIGSEVKENWKIGSIAFAVPLALAAGVSASNTGSTEPIIAPVSGRIIEICEASGTGLKKGSVLAKVFCAEPKSEVTQT